MKTIITTSLALGLFMGALAVPVGLDLNVNQAIADHHKKGEMKKAKDKAEEVMKEKNCSKDADCNDMNENRKDGEKGMKGGMSEEMKKMGKDKVKN